MDPTVEQILAEYERRSADEAKIMHSQPEEFARRVDDFLISVGPATGRMLHLLATPTQSRSWSSGPHYTRPAAMAYQARVRTKRDLDSVLLPIGSGVELSRKHDPTHDRELRKDRRTGRGQSTPVSATLSASPATGSRMAKPNYAHQKKQREEAARKKREEKQQRRQQKKDETPTPGA